MKLELVEDLYARELAEALFAEKKVLQLMPKFIPVARNEDLQHLVEQHTKETEQQIKELENLSQKFSAATSETKGKVASALISEVKAVLKSEAEPDILEAALIFAAQKIEHNEIACYSSLQTMAKLLTLEEDARVLGRILDQEKKMSEGLFALAEAIEIEAIEAETIE